MPAPADFERQECSDRGGLSGQGLDTPIGAPIRENAEIRCIGPPRRYGLLGRGQRCGNFHFTREQLGLGNGG